MRTIATERIMAMVEGRLATVEVPVIPADASDALREGLRRRRVAANTGRCPCGATRPAMSALQHVSAEQNAAHVPFPHTAACPAHDDLLGPEVERWQTRK